MIIQQYKKSPIAMAPDEIAQCINKYTTHTSFVDSRIHEEADIIHFHNRWEATSVKQLITYHSEPERVNRNFHKIKSVVAQYHATLPEYSDCLPIRNIIDFNQEAYTLVKPEKIRIGYSPSVKKKVNYWYDKGYEKTAPILEEIRSTMGVEIDIIHGVPLQKCIERKSKCSIIIDECVTPSYHRSSLEGLALGKMTICSISDEIQDVVEKLAGSTLPVVNVHIEYLRVFLIEILEKYNVDDLYEMGLDRRKWMEEYWNPQDIIQDYINIYRRA